MADRFDEGKRALDSVAPHDVWAKAERRAGDGTVVPLGVAPPPTGRRSRGWMAGAVAGAAAVVLLAIGAVALLTDGDAPVGTGPSSDDTTGPSGDAITTYQADGACKVAIRGEPLPEPTTVSAAETFVEGSVGTLVSGHLNATQTYDVQIPSQVVTDLVGERVEDVQLQRGTAQLWFQTDGAVQVRWFTGSQDACESFTVTIAGGAEDENRHAAVELADRILLPSQLPNEDLDPAPDPNPIANTAWQLERSTVDGVPTDGNGAVFAFTASGMSWSDGCNRFGSEYLLAEDVLARTGDSTMTDGDCGQNPTSDAVNAVMTALRIGWSIDDAGLLHLGAGDTELVLRPSVAAGPEGGSTTTTIVVISTLEDELASTWEMVELEDDGGSVPVPMGEMLVDFLPDEVRWNDGCTGHAGSVGYGTTSITVAEIEEEQPPCSSDPGRDLVNALFRSGAIDVAIDGARATLTADGRTLVLQRWART